MRYLSLIIVLISTTCLAQKRGPDLLVLKNGNAITGKITYSDSTKLTLRRYDQSTETHYWKDLDSVRGLSYRTRFFSASTGISHVNYWSTFLYKNISNTSLVFDYKLGVMRSGHWAKYAELVFIPSKPYKTRRLGVGFNYYFPLEYIQPVCVYAGADFNWTFVQSNADFISVGIHPGVEYWHKHKYRFFAELDLQRAIFNINQNTSVCLLLGVRFGKEYGTYYKKLNASRKLP